MISSSSRSMSSAPPSISSSSKLSSFSPILATSSALSVKTPFCAKRKLSDPFVPSEPFRLVNIERTLLTVRLLLSLKHSMKIAIPPGPYPSKVSSCSDSGSFSALLMARSMLSLGILIPLALFTATRRRGLPLISDPPSFTAIVISFKTREKALLRFASAAPFLRLIVDHLLCPDI